MPSLPFLSKKKAEEPTPAAAPAEESAPTMDAPATDPPAAEETPAVPAETTETPAPAPAPEKKFGGLFRRQAAASSSESEGEEAKPKKPFFALRSPKAAPMAVAVEEKENAPAAMADAPPPAAAAEPVTPTEKTNGVRRSLSLFGRRNGAAAPAPPMMPAEGEAAETKAAKRQSFVLFGTAKTPAAEEMKEEVAEDPRSVEAKAALTKAHEAEKAAVMALEEAKKALKAAKVHVKTVESEIAAEKKKAKTEKKEEPVAAAAPTPPALETVEETPAMSEPAPMPVEATV